MFLELSSRNESEKPVYMSYSMLIKNTILSSLAIAKTERKRDCLFNLLGILVALFYLYHFL